MINLQCIRSKLKSPLLVSGISPFMISTFYRLDDMLVNTVTTFSFVIPLINGDILYINIYIAYAAQYKDVLP